MQNNRKKRNLLSYFIIIILLIIDQLTKWMAVVNLQGNPGVDLIPRVFKFQYLENRGAAFGILENQLLFFYIMTPCVVLTVLYILYKIPFDKKFIPLSACSILLIAGALGNYIDRVRLNYVIDFLYFELIDFPIFNVADIYVCVAVGLYIILLLFYYSEEELEQIKLFKR